MTIQQKIDAALNELANHGMDGGMTTFELAELFGAHAALLRRPYQNAEDNEAVTTGKRQ